jgi:hypothetical protein
MHSGFSSVSMSLNDRPNTFVGGFSAPGDGKQLIHYLVD